MIGVWTLKRFEAKENKRVIKTVIFSEKIDTNAKCYWVKILGNHVIIFIYLIWSILENEDV